MTGEWQECEKESSVRTRNAVIAGAAAALAFIAFVHFSSGVPKQQSPVNASAQEDRTELPPTVIAPSTADVPDSGPSRAITAGRESYVGVYECTVNGRRVVSDRPCASGAQVRTLVVDQPDPRDAAIAQQLQQQTQQPVVLKYSAPSASGESASAGTDVSANEAACTAVDREIDQLNARMRQGYTSQEGEWLRAQWHALEERRRALRCGR